MLQVQRDKQTKLAQKSAITLRGSVQLLCEYLDYGINSILYQRGIYPHEDFQARKMYGLSLLTTTDPALRKYLTTLLAQLEKWMMGDAVEKVVLAIQAVATQEVLERWTFNIVKEQSESTRDGDDDDEANGKENTKTEADVHKEIQAVIRQITASVTFLPLLEEKCTFNLLVYANKHADVPTEWVDSDPLYIPNAEQVRLRSFSTGVHKMDTIVCYKYDDELGGSLC